MSSTTKLHLPRTAIPAGGTVVVSGASGCMGSHICDQLLSLGFKVRGISRNASRAAWLEDLFVQKHGQDRFQLVNVPDFAAEGAFRNAIEGAHGVIHTAADTSLDLNPDNVVPQMTKGALAIAQTAARTESCSRFVYTSSSSAVADPAPGVSRDITIETYNEATVMAAYSSDLRQDLVGGHTVYAAAKVKTEQALWEWYHHESLGLVMNTGRHETPVDTCDLLKRFLVIPSPCYGEVLDPQNQGFTAANGVLKLLWDGNVSEEIVKMFESRTSSHLSELHRHTDLSTEWFCDVKDVASLHVAALLLPEVKSERLFAYADRYTVNDFLRIFKTLEPTRHFPDYVRNTEEDQSNVPNSRSTEVLRTMGLGGWKSLDECIRPLAKQFVNGSI